ncbi:MAG: AsmA family protein, partial [Burkholderiales bacterium]|nr:AsmA family protein [Burkholderiales bacterium]
VDKVEIDGLRAKLVRMPDGKMNIDDLLSKDPQSEEKIKFDIDGVRIGEADLSFDDRMGKRKLALHHVNLETGRIESGVASKLKLAMEVQADNPQLHGKVALSTGFLLDLEQQQYSLKNLDLALDGKALDFSFVSVQAKGDAGFKMASGILALSDLSVAVNGERGGQNLVAKMSLPKLDLNEKDLQADKISASFSMAKGKDKIAVALDAPSFRGSRQAVNFPQLALQIEVTQEQLQAKGKLEVDLQANLDSMIINAKQLKLQMEGKAGDNAIHANISSPLHVDLKRNLANLSRLAVDVKLPHPSGKGTLGMNADGLLTLDWKAQNINSVLKGKLDETSFDAKLGMRDFASPHYSANLVLDKIDADRYRANPSAIEAAQDKSKPEVPVDLSGLSKLQATAQLQVGTIKVANMQMTNLKLEMHAQPGKIDLAPLSANLYGGSVQGSLGLVLGKQQQFIVKQNLTGIQIGPLLKDAIKKNPLDGKGNVNLDISTSGGTLSQWKKGLNGSAKLSLQDGAVSGFNLAKIIREGKSMMSGAGDSSKTGTANAEDKTDFSELSASLKIANGVAHNDDLSLKSPLFRVTGTGDVNLGEDRLDYTVKPTIVATLQGQGGPELQALKGVTIPVRLTGPFTAIGWKIDFGAMAKDMAAQKVNEKKEEVKTQLQDKLKEGLKGLFGK